MRKETASTAQGTNADTSGPPSITEIRLKTCDVEGALGLAWVPLKGFLGG